MTTQTIVLERLLARAMLQMHPNEATGYAWQYLYDNPFTWYGNSDNLNKRTTVQVCESENWFGYPEGTILHLTHTGEVYGTSESIQENGDLFGEEPIFYYADFEIDNHDFELSFDQLREGKILFVPKIEASALYHSMSDSQSAIL
jgi:hypothetical protein